MQYEYEYEGAWVVINSTWTFFVIFACHPKMKSKDQVKFGVGSGFLRFWS